MMRFRDIIDVWPGGRSAFASLIGAQHATVSQWRYRDSIPPCYWRRIVLAAQQVGLGISLNDMAAAAERRAA